ncbi:hypothetical protein [Actinokineospora sp. NBRC 105648]|uniref:hypothetical protein n=1 Tax=Actinokineospora sp. NBRC 105648 TaxID=3032206 RepID=UPI00249FA213|nr:hypothetical protein [Actinokineospora sp. NBRC 105648]GLZ37749.1 hypothetical protein Acsp05_13740 [Actinokineospora sp. NBRC 105648]
MGGTGTLGDLFRMTTPTDHVPVENLAMQQPAPPANRGLKIALAAAGVVIACLATALGVVVSNSDNPPPQASAPPGPQRFTLRGTFELHAGSSMTRGSGNTCAGTGGYSDIASGTSVTVYDGSGTVLGVDYLGTPLAVGSICTFQFGVAVTAGHDYYQVEVSHRGKITVTEADAKAGKVSATLGN